MTAKTPKMEPQLITRSRKIVTGGSQVSRRDFLGYLSGLTAGAVIGVNRTFAVDNKDDFHGLLVSKRGVEKTEFQDPDGRTIWQLTNHRVFESKQTYYDICPWSHDGRYIQFGSAKTADVNVPWKYTVSTPNGQICVLDTRTFEIFVIAKNILYTGHGACFGMWHPTKEKIYCRQDEHNIGAVDLSLGTRSTISGSGTLMRQLSPDGSQFVSLVTGDGQLDAGPDTWGVYTLNAEGSDCKLIIPVKALYDLAPNKKELNPGRLQPTNPKWSPDGQHLLVANTRGGGRRSLYIAKPDGSQLRWLCYFGDHHSWAPDGKSIVFNGVVGNERRIAIIDLDGTNIRAAIDQPVGSHPLMDPSGTRIADFDKKGIYVVHLAERRIERVATYRKPYDTGHKGGTHSHCVWNRTGDQLLYNSAETGHSEVYLVNVGTGQHK